MNLKRFIMDTCKDSKNWEEVLVELRRQVDCEERRRAEEERKAVFIKEIVEELRAEMEEMHWWQRSAGMSRRRDVECYTCGGKGHMARHCTSRPQKGEMNKRSPPYFCERPTEAVAKAPVVVRKETRLMERKKAGVPGSMKELADKYPEPEALRVQERRVEPYWDEKCRIKTKRGGFFFY